MDRVSDRDRSSRKSREDRGDRDRDSSRSEMTKDHRDRDHKHRHHQREKHDDDRRHRSRADSPPEIDPKRERSLDRVRDSVEHRLHHHREKHDDDRRHRSRADSPPEIEPKRERSLDRVRNSVEHRHHNREKHDDDRRHRSRADSPPEIEPNRERSLDRVRNSVEHRHHNREKHDNDRRHRSRADSPPEIDPKRERSRDRVRDSVERDRVRDSVEQDRDRDRVSRKRKDHDYDYDDDDNVDKKRSRTSAERKERRRFEENGDYKEERGEREEKKVKEEELSDVEASRKRKREGRRFSDRVKIKEDDDEDGTKTVSRKESREERRFKDRVKEEDLGGEEERKPRKDKSVVNGDKSNGSLDKGGSTSSVIAQEPHVVASEVSMASAASSYSLPTKVSSITTTNENQGVSIIRSDEVPGKSSTDGTTTSVAGKTGSLSLDALAKAKRALQMQKELSEKLKKIPMLNKLSSTSNSQVASNRDGQRISPAVVGSQHVASTSATVSTTPVQVTSSSTSVPVSTAFSVDGTTSLPGLGSQPAIEAVKRAQELAAKMGYRQDPEFAPLINMFPGSSAVSEMAAPQRPSKAPVLRLDAQGREIDEHGNVINMPKLTNLSTLKVNINKQKKEAFQILRPELDADIQSDPHFDERMGINKTKLLRPKRMSFQFVEEGKWAKQAEIIKIKNQFGEAQSKELKVKQSQLAKAKAEPDDNPNLIAIGERVFKEKKKDEIPEIEWWDKPLLPSSAYTEDAGEKINFEKITIYVEHPRPIEPPAEPAPPPPQPLKLTKKEQKKLRTQRRLAKERDRQEMIRQGLLEPPKPKVKMSNLMRVLGSEATQDPTRLEMEIRSAAAEREQAHVDRNIARKLTPAERREKKERKLFEDPNTLETLVSLYKIKDLSHPQTRFKVDVNAQENHLTGCAVISDGISVVVVEGGKKSIKRYGKLMLKRINWAAAVNDDEDGDEKDDSPVNSCVLVWQGSVARPSFNRFLVHQCRSEAAARKVFADAGVPHYWDLSINFSDD